MSLIECPGLLKCSDIALEIFNVLTSLLWALERDAAVSVVFPVYWSSIPGCSWLHFRQVISYKMKSSVQVNEDVIGNSSPVTVDLWTFDGSE